MMLRSAFVLLSAACLGLALDVSSLRAATIAPPMLDVTRQCNAMSHGNTTLMSECVVAESEARADLLQHWGKLPDEAVDRCVKLARKAKRQPYVAMEKCLSAELAGPPATPVNDLK